MQQVPIQQDNVTSLSAVDFNPMPREIENAIQASDQALAADEFQLAKSLSAHAGGADFYEDTGAVDAHVLQVIGSRQYPPAYYLGLRVRFKVANTNTGTAVTVQLGSLAAVPVHIGQLANGGTPTVAVADIGADSIVEMVYDETPDTLTQYFRMVSVAVENTGGTRTSLRTLAKTRFDDSADDSSLELTSGFGTLPAARYVSGNTDRKISWDKDEALVQAPPGVDYTVGLKTSNTGKGVSWDNGAATGPGLDVLNFRCSRFNIPSLTYSSVTGGYVSTDNYLLTGIPYASGLYFMAWVVFTASGNEYVTPAQIVVQDDGSGVAEVVSTRVFTAVAPDVGSASNQRLLIAYNAVTVD